MMRLPAVRKALIMIYILCSPEASQLLTLVESFLLTSFYPYQKAIINAVLEKQDSIVIQSTGNGKSLCFQFPPVYLRKKAVVVMPTISLMRDQTIQVNEFGIKVAYMGSAAKYQAATIAALIKPYIRCKDYFCHA